MVSLTLCSDRTVTRNGSGSVRTADDPNLADTFRDGAQFVNLAPLSDPDLVATAIAQTLGVRETCRPLRDSLQDFLREKHLLLLLDNFEQVVAAAPLVGELLAAAPDLKVLTTSRTTLHLSEEHELPVPPLVVPDPRQGTHVLVIASNPPVVTTQAWA
jgi:predicted ATPase